jgi:hypothetical protein
MDVRRRVHNPELLMHFSAKIRLLGRLDLEDGVLDRC